MGEVTITVNGRPYRMACEDGQEDHLQRLGEDLAARVADLAAQVGQANDAQLLVMAALITADEVRELSDVAVGGEPGERVAALEEELAEAGAANAALAQEMGGLRDALAKAEEAAMSASDDDEFEAERDALKAEMEGLRQELDMLRRERAAQATAEANAAEAIENLSGRVARLAEALQPTH